MKLGKETLLKKYYKNELEADLNSIIYILSSDEKYEIQVFAVDEGRTDQDVEFCTWRFYFKEKSEDNKLEVPNYQEMINRKRNL